MSITERIGQILRDKKMKDSALAAGIGLDKTKFSNRMNDKTPWTVKDLRAISEITGYSFTWICEGYGPERIGKKEAVNDLPVANESEQPNYGNPKLAKRIPFYDVEAVGGINGGDVTPITHPTGTIDIGDFLRDSEAAIRMAGNSMMPGYPPGCILGLIPKKNRNITPGEVYVYEDEDGRHCKRLFYKNDDPTSDTYTCYSDTTTVFESGPRKGKLFYPPYEIKADSIINLFTVVGMIKRNSNSVIKYKQEAN